jgi:hypothetical protein
MSPDWDQAPTWAKWFVASVDGTYWWSQKKPILRDELYWPRGLCEQIITGPSLKKRPSGTTP